MLRQFLDKPNAPHSTKEGLCVIGLVRPAMNNNQDAERMQAIERAGRAALVWPLVLFSLPLYYEFLRALGHGELDFWSVLVHVGVVAAFGTMLYFLLYRPASPRRLWRLGWLMFAFTLAVIWAVGLHGVKLTLFLFFHLWFLFALSVTALWSSATSR